LPVPTGALGSVSVLPETGLRSPSQPATTPLESNLVTPQGQWPLHLLFAGGFIIGLSCAISGLVFLARYLVK